MGDNGSSRSQGSLCRVPIMENQTENDMELADRGVIGPSRIH